MVFPPLNPIREAPSLVDFLIKILKPRLSRATGTRHSPVCKDPTSEIVQAHSCGSSSLITSIYTLRLMSSRPARAVRAAKLQGGSGSVNTLHLLTTYSLSMGGFHGEDAYI